VRAIAKHYNQVMRRNNGARHGAQFSQDRSIALQQHSFALAMNAVN
jgi:hypothetical protein